MYDCPDIWNVRHVGHIVNPVLVSADAAEPTLTRDEGCLSVPGPVASLTRPAAATVTGVDLHGNPVRVTGHGLFARCLQHECDHLDGQLYVDRLPGRTRRAVLREMDQITDDVWAHWGERAAALGKV